MSTRRRAATLQDVATLAGVSVRTVSNVVNDFPHVRPATRERVQAAVAELGYRINPIARNLRLGSTRTLGLVLPEFSQPYYAELADAALAAARDRGYQVVIEATGATLEDDRPSVLRDLALITDGLVLSPTRLTPGGTPLDQLGVPVVVLADRTFDSGADHVTMDDAAGARLATAHLLERGRRRILALGSPQQREQGSGTAHHRFAGYLRAHADVDLEAPPELARPVTEWIPDNGHDATLAVLREGVPFDAIFAFNDQMAIGAMHALRSHGLNVPDDVALVGFDNISSARHLAPPLTTIAPGMHQVVETALDLLLARIDGTRTGRGEAFRARCELVVRGSSDPSAGA